MGRALRRQISDRRPTPTASTLRIEDKGGLVIHVEVVVGIAARDVDFVVQGGDAEVLQFFR